MRIATFNVNGIKSRLPNLLAWLERERPDIACLQELKSENGAFPEAALAKAGYASLWNGQRSWNGVAILAEEWMSSKFDASSLAIHQTTTAGTSKRKWMIFASHASTCRMGIRSPARNSITSCVGSNA
jgi:exonuclease III